MNKPPVLGPYATKHQIDQVVFKDNKYRRYEIEIADDEEKTAKQPIKVILLKPLEGKILLLQRICFACIENTNVLKNILYNITCLKITFFN